ncbi:hypothetical protein [Chitinophaga sp. Cy-1792]|uniref:hypothetical protein n=1 Tax=Chitinophaga sp. Cy-1792 TaxID=2608339 RepID=UPI001423FD6E|nr:hypothetical protein [Chitinophaga sp. Cy-1792]NIG54054.1 hypothetical protein [Chitinophaga sp. Cy-1792]
MTFLYTARARFDKESEPDHSPWTKYIQWSRLYQLTELVSMDTCLNEVLVEPDRDNDDDWKEFVFNGYAETGCFKTLEYVLAKTDTNKRFNLLTVVIQPESDCSLIQLDNYDFLGYDLMDDYYDTSALSNCSGFDETFLPSELNNYGLISDYEKACSISDRLYENNPGEDHADTNIVAIWRHRTIGW